MDKKKIVQIFFQIGSRPDFIINSIFSSQYIIIVINLFYTSIANCFFHNEFRYVKLAWMKPPSQGIVE